VATAPEKDSLEIATPPEFHGGLSGYWSPEDLLVAATASCFAVTLAAVCERREAPLIDATIRARGHLSRRADGQFGFTVIELVAELETLPGFEDAVQAAAKAAEGRCLVSRALAVPVDLVASVTSIERAAHR
jgi:organic hydroperoxide reductase OsmC/OhrA